MMKNIFPIFMAIVLIGCKHKITKSETEIRYYPSKEFFHNRSLTKINMDGNNLTFKDIADSVSVIYKDNMLPYFELVSRNRIKKIIPLSNRPDGDIKEKNMLLITKDSIMLDNHYSYEKMAQLLKRHYENNGKIPYYSESAERAYLEISLDTAAKAEDFKRTLDTITTVFDKINNSHSDTLQLKITLSYWRQVTPPPPAH